MTNPTETRSPSFLDQKRAALKSLRSRARGKVYTDGIWLCVRFRGCYDANDFAGLVEAAGGMVAENAKTRKARHTGDLVHRVVFSVDVDADLYIEGKLGLREVRL